MRVKAHALLLPALLSILPLALSACLSSSTVQQGPSDTLRAYALALEDGRVEDAYRLLSDEAKRSMSIEAFRRAVKENPQDAAEIARALARPATDPVVTATVVVPNGDELLLVYEGGAWRIDQSAVDLYGQATPRQAILGFLRAFERRRYDVVLRYVPDAEREGAAGMEEAPAEPAEPSKAVAQQAPPPKDTAQKPGETAKPGEAKPAVTAAGAPAPPGAADEAKLGGQLTADKLRAAWEGPQKEQINRIVQAIKTALPTAQIEETGDNAAMPYGAGGTVAFVREHGAWKIRDF
jgi:hypothetical protein